MVMQRIKAMTGLGIPRSRSGCWRTCRSYALVYREGEVL
jgi:hypothetical protein